MGILFTILMGIQFTITIGFLFTIVPGIQFTISRSSPYGYAAYSISQIKEPLSTMKRELKRIRGVGEVTEKIILEILETKSSSYYEKLLIE